MVKMSNRSTVLNSASPLPAERRLGKFHGCYSPGNLHKTPKRCRQFRGQDDAFSRNYQFQHNISPFDRCKSVKINRNRKLWRAPWQDNSFEGNQSFPSIRLHTASMMDADTNSKTKPPPNTVRVDGPNGVRFNSSLAINLPGEPQSVTGLNQQQIDRLQQGINPNKAVFTIEPKTSKILIVNSKACSLLGYSSTDLCNMNFYDLLRDKNTSKIRVRDGEVSNDEGTIVLLSGKVVEMLSSRGAIILVSLWIRQLETEGPCLVVVAEPVHSKEAILTVDGETGFVTCCESEDSALLFQVESVDKLIGMQISSLIPSVVLPQNEGCIPKHISKQKATGRTLDGGTFPLCLWIKPQDVDANIIGDKERRDSKYSKLYTITIRVFHNVSGLLVVDETGLVSACNHHFTMLTFGKAHSEVIGQPVTQIIPNFCQAGELLKMSHRRNMTLSPVPNDDDNSDSDSDPIDSCGVFNGSQKSACMSYNIQQSQTSQITHDKSSSAFCLDKSSSYIMTQTPTPTQDMVSSLSTTELKIDNDYSAVPDVVSGISGISIEEEQYCQANISKSRSENILGSENRENNINVANRNNENKSSDRSDSLYYSSKYSNENSAAVQRARLVDPAMRLSLDSSKYRQTLKSALAGQGREDKSSISVDLCDSNETSADFLTPINEMPGSGEGDVDIDEIEDLPRQSINGEDQEECEQVGDSSTLSPKQILELNHYAETPLVVKRVMRAHLTTSTPQNVDKCSAGKQDNSSSYRICDLADCPSNCQHKDGTYKGTVLHKDGTELSIIYTVSSMQMSSGNRVQCVWLGVQLSDEVVQMPHTTLASSINSTAENSLVIQGNKSVASRPQSMSLMSQCGEEQISGDYNKFYVTLKQIGKGAFGCVKMAYRRSDRLLVIAKFILKEKVSQQFWVDDKNGKKIPLEVSLLLTLKHPNIVNVLDVFENDKYFQMIMEKHGSGMDLFEFIERRPQLDEPLISYIFRQIGLAVDYLHSLSILHRDIKDENVIIDNRFHVKLIDFGSATFMNKDVLFSTFYGTTEYCSPEVLGGNKYAGPELEMWSMGVTLFVLTFFENPFVDIEDTIQGSLTVPPTVSTDLDHLLRWMLCKDPVARCTVSQLMAHQWINQTTNITKYNFADLIECETHEANPEIYYSGSFNSPRSSSPSNADVGGKEQSNPSEHGMKYEGKNPSKDDQKKSSFALYALSAADKDAQSDNYSLRSSADILDISSKPMSDAALTDISSDATGHAACDIEYDIDQYDCDSWDECEQDSFS